MKFLAVYDKDATDYETNRLCHLENAKDVHISQAINGDYSLEFKLPRGDKKWEFVEVENKVGYDGNVFRIKDINGLTVTAMTLMQDSCRTHIQYIEDMISEPANEIFEKIFETTPYVKVLTKQELLNLGLEPVTDKIDFFELSKKTPMGCVKILMERLNKYKIHSEVYIDNEKIGLVRQLGKDRGVTVDPKYNANNMKAERSTYTLITKLYPYGRDDLPLDQSYKILANGTLKPLGKTSDGAGYILSPNYDTLGEYEGFCNFDEITDPEELREAAQWQFSDENIDRIDVPKYSIPFKFVDVNANEKIKLGDTVTVNDRDHGITSKQRVISVDIYPFEPNKSKFEVGTPNISMQEAMTTMFMASQYLRLSKNRSEELKTSTIEFMKKNSDVTVENDGEFQKIAEYDTGALFVSPDGMYAVAIIDGKVKVGTRNSSKLDGWEWTGVFGRGEVHVSKVFTGNLYTDQVKLTGEGAKLTIDNNLITFKDSTADGEVLRSQWGFNGDKYIFEMYNKEGDKTLHMNEDGEAEFGGVINTQKDVNIGRKLVLRDIKNGEGFSITGQGDFLSESVNLHANNNRTINITTDGNITIKAGNILNLNGEVNINGVEAATKTDIENVKTAIQNLEFKVDALHA